VLPGPLLDGLQTCRWFHCGAYVGKLLANGFTYSRISSSTGSTYFNLGFPSNRRAHGSSRFRSQAVKAAAPLFDKAGVSDSRDEGLIELKQPRDCSAFIHACRQLRYRHALKPSSKPSGQSIRWASRQSERMPSHCCKSVQICKLGETSSGAIFIGARRSTGTRS
jgi:hypothetical protein